VIVVSKNEWMFVTLKSDTRFKVVKIYSMSSKNKQLINEIFDKLHFQEEMHWIKKSIVHEVSIFVIWRMMNDEKKRRMMIDIRELNKITKSDFYSMSLQSDIISVVADFKFISIINATTFFYQFRVKTSDRHKLTIVSHRKQKFFSIALMSFKTRQRTLSDV
jgi:hypothetical protein